MAAVGPQREDVAAAGLRTVAVMVSCGYPVQAGKAAGNPFAGPWWVRETARTDEVGEAAVTAAPSIQERVRAELADRRSAMDERIHVAVLRA
jgi:hypothetical protein